MARNYFQLLLFALVFLEATVYVDTLDCWFDSIPAKEENAWKEANPNGTWNGTPGLMIKPVTCANTSHDCIYLKCYKTIKRADVYYKEVGCGVPKNCTGEAVEICKTEAYKENLFKQGQLPEVVCNSCHGNMCNKDENGTMTNGAVGKDVGGIWLNAIMMGLLMAVGVEVLLDHNGA